MAPPKRDCRPKMVLHPTKLLYDILLELRKLTQGLGKVPEPVPPPVAPVVSVPAVPGLLRSIRMFRPRDLPLVFRAELDRLHQKAEHPFLRWPIGATPQSDFTRKLDAYLKDQGARDGEELLMDMRKEP